MKLYIYLSCFIFLQNSFLFGQIWYGGLDAGYTMGLAPQNITSEINIGSTQTSNTVVKGSFGKGVSLNGFVGYKLTNHLSCEIGLSYLKGSSFKGRTLKDTVFKQDVSISGSMLRLTPALRITSGEESDKLRVYLKIGIVFRLAGHITNNNTYFDIQENSTTVSEIKYSNGFSAGAVASAGLERRINNRMSLFGELFFIAQSWSPKNGNVVKYSVNGVDQLEVLYPGQKHFHFSNSYTNTNNTQSTYEPTKQLKQYHNFSSLGLKIGIQFALGKSK